MNYYRPTGFNILPNVVKHLMIINGLMFLATIVLHQAGDIRLIELLGLRYFGSSEFRPYQIATHMFMHGSFMHLFSNMFALWMFGSVLENFWGPKRFLFYYLFTAIGAVTLHIGVIHLQVMQLVTQMDVESVQQVYAEGAQLLQSRRNYIDPQMSELNYLINVPTVGASGAVFGVLLGFGMLFPNTHIFLLLLPIPIKAKYFVILYAAFELYAGLQLPGSGIAHFAHLGGMLFGVLLIWYWRKQRNLY